jgi:hypothetical protein
MLRMAGGGGDGQNKDSERRDEIISLGCNAAELAPVLVLAFPPRTGERVRQYPAACCGVFYFFGIDTYKWEESGTIPRI